MLSDVKNWILDPVNKDQDSESKTSFIQTSKAGKVTRLAGAGISNGKLKKKCIEFAKKNDSINIEYLLKELNNLFLDAEYTEERLAVYYLLERYKKIIILNSKMVFDFINENWIDEIDHWTTSDHLCINVFAHINFDAKMYNEISTWKLSNNYWRRRLSITALLKHTKNHDASKFIVIQISSQIKDINYYVRKSIPWLLRTISKTYPNMIEIFLNNNFVNLSKTELKEASKYLSLKTQNYLLDEYINFKSK